MQPVNSSGDLENLLKQLSEREHAVGPNDISLLTTVDQIAAMSLALSRYEHAEAHYRRALRIRRYADEISKKDLIGNLHRLAVLYRIQEKFLLAEDAFSEALIIAQQIHGQDHLEVATRLNYMAGLLHASGKRDQAIPLIERSLRIYEKHLGKNTYFAGVCYLALAIINQLDGFPETAHKYYEMASNIVRTDAAHGLSTRLVGLTLIYFGQEKYEEADVLLRQALVLEEEQLWAYHPLVPKSLNVIGDLCQSQGLFAEAESAYKGALDKQIQAIGRYQTTVFEGLVADHSSIRYPFTAGGVLHRPDPTPILLFAFVRRYCFNLGMSGASTM